MYVLSALFLVLSGTAALTYQVSWVRLLGLSMGSTSAAISTVLAAFFLGMALGSYTAERITRQRIQNLTPYIVLEALIALSGLLLLPTLLNLDGLMAEIGASGGQLGTKFAITLTLLLIPTLCMGATFPVMAGILVRRHQHVGLRVSQLYSLNTLGAVFGAMLSGFVFIPNFGLDGAIYIAVALNLTIVFIGMMANRRLQFPPLEDRQSTDKHYDSMPGLGVRSMALATLFMTGFVSIATEVGWTKYLSIFAGTTIYGFASILTIFLFGIAMGSWFIKNHIQRIRHPAAFLGLSMICLALLFLFTRGGLSLVPSIYEGINHMSIEETNKQFIKYLTILFLLFPATFVLGLIFPVNLRLYCGDLDGVRQRVGKAYAVNTLASILGSLAAGFWIIPTWGTDTLLSSMAILTLVTGALFILITTRPAQRTAIALCATVALSSHFLWPHLDYREMIASVDYMYDEQASQGKEPEFLFLKEGKVSVISLVTYDGEYAKVQANGLNESIINMKNNKQTLIIESLLAYMPYFLHPNPESAFVVGYGGGLTTRAFTHTDVKSVRVVELEPTVVEAIRTLENGPAIALDDPRVNLSFNDARNTLLVEDKRYDIIAAQASHPWLAGASNVFTQEFFTIVKSRLNEGGFYSQWVNLFKMDVTTLRSIFKAFTNVFPYVISFANIDTGDFMLLGSLSPIHYDYDQVSERMKHPSIAATLAHYEVYQAQDLLWYFALSQKELKTAAGDAIPNRDTNIFTEVRLSALSASLQDEENPYRFLNQNYRIDLGQYIDKKELAERLYSLGKAFLKWDSPGSTEKIIHQLKTVSETHSDSLQHHLLVWKFNLQAATTWFEEHPRLQSDALSQQTRVYLLQNKAKQARTLANNIPDDNYRQATLAEIAFSLGETLQRPAVDADPSIRQWYLATQLNRGNEQIINELEQIARLSLANPVVLRRLTAYYLSNDNVQLANHYLAMLKKQIDTEVERYRLLIDTAIKAGDTRWAEGLLSQIKTLAPEHQDLPTLMSRLESSILEKGELSRTTKNQPHASTTDK
ncbi:MAG: fused MFS/spermidine synthase [Gammaproteobacteria bacterium]|nr:fused MFS/spermidine synthase [Gammaproteobacteria bacterium]